ncbi:hypothetical protein ADK90_20365 [Streptomyces sp. XY413]|nr:hypothetical protein ADK90_20365 [Streptomyces sp. XY413]
MSVRGIRRAVLDVTLVRPELVAEVSASTAVDQGGVFRLPVRFERWRLGVTVDEVPLFSGGPSAAAG